MDKFFRTSAFVLAFAGSWATGTAADASPTPKATTTRLTVSEVGLGHADIAQWQVTVKGPRIAAGQIRFVLSIGEHSLATFTTTAASPTACSFKETITSTFGELVKSTAPDVCTGGVAGYVQLSYAQVTSSKITLRARYLGASGWGASESGAVNPERVTASRPLSA